MDTEEVDTLPALSPAPPLACTEEFALPQILAIALQLDIKELLVKLMLMNAVSLNQFVIL